MDNAHNWTVCESADAVAEQALAILLESAQQAIAQNGAFHLVTAGGTTPNHIYQRLAKLDNIDWSRWHIYMGDERVLPADDSERNSKTLSDLWLNHVAIPASQIHFMPTELGLEQAADYYQSVIQGVHFDCVMLGMGEDGHTASLFPNHNLNSQAGVVLEYDSPKPPSQRLSLSYEVLSSATLVLKLITGAGKAEVISRWHQGESFPISQVQGRQEKVLLDKAAASLL